jgi:hypothetical protein
MTPNTRTLFDLIDSADTMYALGATDYVKVIDYEEGPDNTYRLSGEGFDETFPSQPAVMLMVAPPVPGVTACLALTVDNKEVVIRFRRFDGDHPCFESSTGA